MRGEILSFDETGGAGLISGDDGVRYRFARAAIRNAGESPRPGQRVDFVPAGGEASDIMLLAAPVTASPAVAPAPGVPVGALEWKSLLFSFEGRIRRAHFWIAWLVLLGVGVVFGWIPLLGAILSLALIWPHLAIAVKRLHDMGKSGWLVAIPWGLGVVTFVGALVSVGVNAIMNAAALEAEDPAAILTAFGPAVVLVLICMLLQLGFLLWIGLSEGQPGDNRFGPNPKGL